MAEVTATPNPATVGSKVALSGCGYQTDRGVQVKYKRADGSVMSSYWVGMWSSGCMDGNYTFINEAGTFTVEVLQDQNRKPHSSPDRWKMEVVATTELVVS